jgi:hypothetical protein
MYKFEDLINRLPKEIVDSLKATDQSPKWHPEGFVYNHVEQVYTLGQYLYPDDEYLLVSAIMHDLGKIDKTQVVVQDDGTEKIRAIGHEYKSLDYIKDYWELYKDIEPDYDRVRKITKNHMKAHYYINGTMKRPHKRQMFEENKYFDDIIKFSSLDDYGRIEIGKYNDLMTILMNKEMKQDDIIKLIKESHERI